MRGERAHFGGKPIPSNSEGKAEMRLASRHRPTGPGPTHRARGARQHQTQQKVMVMGEFFEAHQWALPLIIFFGRICDVTLGTLRIIFVSKGERTKAPIVGFFEVFIWVVVISQIFAHANDLIAYLSYAAGYAAGNYVGIMVENKIAFGFQLFRVYTRKDGQELARLLNSNGFGSTCIKGQGAVSEVSIIETVVSRKAVRRVTQIIDEFDPTTFYLVEDIRSKSKGIFTMSTGGLPRIGK